jgi:hypothetical protein
MPADMTKLTVAFRNFTNAPTKGKRSFRIRVYIIFFLSLDDKSKRREMTIQWQASYPSSPLRDYAIK